MAWRYTTYVLCALLTGLQPLSSLARSAGQSYVIEVLKSRKILMVKQGGKVVRSYRTAVGKGGKGDKQRSGDHKTPVGTYRVVGFNDNSRFFLFMQLNYPNIKDAFYGLKKHLIGRRQFDRIVRALKMGKTPPQDTPLGGAIGIHGLGAESKKRLLIHENYNWTEGCIALTNEEIMDLKKYVRIGTKVVINE